MTIRRLIRQAQALVPVGKGITVVACHLVGAGTASPVDQPTSLFERQLASLRENDVRVYPLAEAAARLASGDVPDGPAAVLTFDDAYENFYTQVYPRLRSYDLPVTLYVPTHFIMGKTPPPIAGTEGLPPCSWDQLREMQASGLVTVGAHTCTHPSLTDVSPARAQWEIEASRDILEDRLGAPVKSFCYPRALWTAALEEMVAATYDTAVVGGGVQQRPQTFRPHRMQRVSLRRDAPADLLPILRSRVWLEEWLADRVRHLRRYVTT